MRSLKKMVEATLIILILALVSSVLINNFYIKPILNIWKSIDNNSREFGEIYGDADFNIRVMNNILAQLSYVDTIETQRYIRISQSYDNSYNQLIENLDKAVIINNLNMKLLEKVDSYFFYNKMFKREELKIELQSLDSNINEISNKIIGLNELKFTERDDVLNSTYKMYLNLNDTIDSFDIKLQKINMDNTNNLINTFNMILIFLFGIITIVTYFVNRIIRKNAKYMIYSLEMLNNNNYNISMLPKIKSKFKEEEIIQNDVESIFKERQFINQIKEILSGEYILDEIIEKLLYLVKDSMNTNRIGIAYIDYKKGRIVAEHGAFDYGKVSLGPGFSVPIEQSSLKNIIETKKGIITNSLPEELKKRPNSPSLKLLSEEGIKSNLIIALILNDTVFGYLFFSSVKENNYTEKDLKLGIKIAQEISGILNTTYLTKKMFVSMTNAFANLVEKKDNDTGDHILRMTNYSRIIAEALIEHEDPEYKVSQSFVNDIFNYAPVHDIGKVGIPDSILKKPGKLTP